MFIRVRFDEDSICYINMDTITNVVVDGNEATIYMVNDHYPISLTIKEAEPLLLKLESLCPTHNW